MAKLIEQPEQFKAELKDKWLDYYEVNRNWLQRSINDNRQWLQSVTYEEKFENGYNPRRPNSFFLLGIISAIEPQLKGLLSFAPLHDPNLIIKNLGLDFDPEIELKKRPEKEKTPSEYLDKIREEIKT